MQPEPDSNRRPHKASALPTELSAIDSISSISSL